MTKIRRQKKKKRFQYNINRKRLKKKICGGVSEAIKNGNEWKPFVITQKNFEKNGLAFDVNQDIKLLNKNISDKKINNTKNSVVETNLISQLEEAANVIVKKQSNMSRSEIDYLDYLVHKYGDNYKEMARDKRNYLQHTWKQLKNKIKIYKVVKPRLERILTKQKHKNEKNI